jgi:predicted TIM-barrel fold metal-dependent hydrolase
MLAGRSPSARARARLGHPVVDSDGHVREFLPAALPYLRETLPQRVFDEISRTGSLVIDQALASRDGAARRRMRIPQVAWWAQPTRNMLDRATAAIPRLMYERLDELGIDYAVLYPTNSLGVAGVADEEVRRGLCRGFNDFFAEVYGPFADRMTVAGLIPMHTPGEAIAELHHCHQIGLKVVAIPQEVIRPIDEPPPPGATPWLWPNQTHWADTYAIDSAHDYDPVWRTFAELGYAVNSHGAISLSPRIYSSVTNFSYNHAGSFAAMMQALCKALYIGGVTRRFPELPFAFLECGVGWASILLSDVLEIWEKRSLRGLDNTDPRHLRIDVFEQYLRDYGPELIAGLEDRLGEVLPGVFRTGPVPEQRDDYALMQVSTKSEMVDLFAPRFWFGCEPDDRTVAFAFSPANPLRAQLQPVLSSDISHWDVPEMNRAVAESVELLDDGVLTEEQLRAFLLVNPVRLYGRVNPAFFEGTPLAAEAQRVLAGES